MNIAAKRFLALFLILGLALTLIPFTRVDIIAADNNPIISLNNVDIKAGSKFSLNLTAENFKNVQSAVILIKYDSSYINFLTDTNSAGFGYLDDDNFTLVVNKAYNSNSSGNNGIISCAFMHPQNFSADFLLLAQLEFESTSAAPQVSIPITIEVVEFFVEQNGKRVNLTKNQITLNNGSVNPKAFRSVDNNLDTIFTYENDGKTITGLTEAGKSYEYIEIPSKVTANDVTRIEVDAFKGNTKLKNIILPLKLEQIGNGAFSGCTNLKNISLASVPGQQARYLNVENGVLYDSKKTRLYAYPIASELLVFDTRSIEEMPEYAFQGAENLKILKINKNLSSLPVESALSNLPNLKAFDVDSGNKEFASVDGVLFNKSKTGLLKYPAAKTDKVLSIAENVIDIPLSVLSKAKYIENINVSSANTAYSSISGVLFNKAAKTLLFYPLGKTASSYYLPASVTNISDNVFANATKIKDIYLSDNITSLGSNFDKIYVDGKLIDRSSSAYNWTVWVLNASNTSNLLKNKGIAFSILPPTLEKQEINVYYYSTTKDIDLSIDLKNNTFENPTSDDYIIKNNVLTIKKSYLEGLKKKSAGEIHELKFKVKGFEQEMSLKFYICADGDVDGDKRITAADARLALRISAKLENPTANAKAAADVNGDGNITAADARLISRVSARLQKLPSDI